MKRWVGLGVIADNLVNMGRVIDEQSAPAAGGAPAGRKRLASRRLCRCMNFAAESS
jgi:hypothetical protein